MQILEDQIISELGIEIGWCNLWIKARFEHNLVKDCAVTGPTLFSPYKTQKNEFNEVVCFLAVLSLCAVK